MGRRLCGWLLAFPLVATGSLAAHALAYRLIEPGGHAREHLLAESGHGYLDAAPFLLAVLLAFGVAGFTAYAVRGFRGRPAAAPPWALAALPPLSFAIQEPVERLFGPGGLAADAALEPTFLVGIALQLPFGLAAAFLARRLARAAESLGRRLGQTPAARAFPATLVRPPLDALPRRTSVLAAGAAGRAPPH